MRTILLLLLSLTSAAALTLGWDAPAQNADIVGYRLKWGALSQQPTQEVDVGLALTATLPDMTFTTGVTYFFVAVSYNAAGMESVFSNEVQWTKPVPTPTPTPSPTPTPQPSPPQNLRLLTVANGSGDGTYRAGTVVTVTADKPFWWFIVFSQWTGDWGILANRYASTTTATIPAKDAAIAAQYKWR